MSAVFIAPIPTILVIKVAILQLESVRYQQRHRIHDVHVFNTELAMHYRAKRDFVAVFWSIFLVIKAKHDQSGSCFLFNLLCEWFFWSISWEDGSHRTDLMGMKTPCLGAHLGSLKKTLVAQTHNLGTWAPVRQQPCSGPDLGKEPRGHAPYFW